MNDFIITLRDLQEFSQGKAGNRVASLLQQFISELPPELKKEANSKEFELVENSKIEEDPLARYYLLRVLDSSAELQESIEQTIPSVICIKDY